jgi:hypothetical protein
MTECFSRRLASDAEITSSRLARTLVSNDFEVNLLTFVETAQASLLDSADMNEHVLATIIRLDEAVALCRVEPFHSSRSHGKIPYKDKHSHRRIKDTPRDIEFIWKFQQTPYGERPIGQSRYSKLRKAPPVVQEL